MSAVLLLLVVALVAWMAWRGRAGLERLKAADPAQRRRAFRAAILAQIAVFAMPAFLVFVLTGRGLPPLTILPFDLWNAAGWLGVAPDGDAWFRNAYLLIPVLGILAVVVRERVRRWRGRPVPAPRVIGDVVVLLARDRAEVLLLTGMSVAAGVCEELFFRLLVPVLIADATGSLVLTFIGATLLFGLAHVYQGWRGVLGTSMIGALLMLIYLLSGWLLVAMLFHATIDFLTLALRPALRGAWARPSSSAATPS